jgi:type III secretion protein U
MAEDKGHLPTKKKLKTALQKGRVVKSRFLTQSCATALTALLTAMLLHQAWVESQMLLEYIVVTGAYEPLGLCKKALRMAFFFIATILGSAVCVSIVVERMQSGGCFELGLLAPQFSRVSPGEGLNRLKSGFSSRLWPLLVMTLFLVIALYLFARGMVPVLATLTLVPSGTKLALISSSLGAWLLKVLLVLVVMGLGEYALERRRFYRELSMSEQEIRREHREEEGDPYIKHQRRSLHEQILYQDLVARVRRSKVVVVERSQ